MSKTKTEKIKTLTILIIILGIALFFRTYKAYEWLDWAHDADLYGWIVKDILIHHHPRLIGQLTTAPGIFIGPAFYYMLTPFFALNNMLPYSGILPITIMGLVNVASTYYVFNKIFNREVGLIATFLQAVLLASFLFDRSVVPSTPTNLWILWFFYASVMITRRNRIAWPILGLLVGTIWHIHVALAPVLLVIPVAIYLSRAIPKLKDITFSLLAFIIPSIPLILFETRHGFQQAKSLLINFTADHGAGSGIDKFVDVISMIAKNINILVFSPQGFENKNMQLVLTIGLLSLGLVLLKKKLIDRNIVIISYVWIFAVVLFFSLNSSPISEYYFKSIEIIFIAFISVFLGFLFSKNKFGKVLVLLLLIIVGLKNCYYLINHKPFQKGYLTKKAIVDHIIKDSNAQGFPCVGISYITTPGENVGFRYLFWLNEIHVVHPQLGAPIYTIVIPSDLIDEKEQIRFGNIGVIPPNPVPEYEQMIKVCEGENTNLTDPMFGFVN